MNEFQERKGLLRGGIMVNGILFELFRLNIYVAIKFKWFVSCLCVLNLSAQGLDGVDNI